MCVPIDVVSPLANEAQELKRERERERLHGGIGNPDRQVEDRQTAGTCGDAYMGLLDAVSLLALWC